MLSVRQTYATGTRSDSPHPAFRHQLPLNKPSAPDSAFAFTAVAATDLLTTVAHGLVAGIRIRVSSTTTLPGGLASATDYYVIASGLTVDAFKVSATLGGSAVDITSVGTGTHSWQRYLTSPETVEFLAWKNLYNAEADQVTITSVEREPGTFPFLLALAYPFISGPIPNLFTAIGHGLASGQRVRVKSTGTLPAPLAVGTDYYVIAAHLTADSFMLSATLGGTELTITDAGKGTHWVDTNSLMTLAHIAAHIAYYDGPAYNNWWLDNFLSKPAQWDIRKADVAIASEGTIPPSGTVTGVGSGAAASPIPPAVEQCLPVSLEITSGTLGGAITVTLSCDQPGSTIQGRLNTGGGFGGWFNYIAPFAMAAGNILERKATAPGLSESVTSSFTNT